MVNVLNFNIVNPKSKDDLNAVCLGEGPRAFETQVEAIRVGVGILKYYFLQIRTQDRRMVGTDVSTELWWPTHIRHIVQHLRTFTFVIVSGATLHVVSKVNLKEL